MRNSITFLGALFVLLLSFTSCLEEQSATTILPGSETEAALGEGTMSYRGVESPIVAVYDMNSNAENMGTSNTVDYATIILSNRDMQGAGQRLTQTGDAIILNIIKDGSLPGTYEISGFSSGTPDVQFFSNVCTGINFATGAMDDDEGMEDGQSIITRNDDGTYTISFDFVTSGRNRVNGSWTGDLTPAVN